METPTGHDRKAIVCFCEFLGTALFIFGIIETSIPISIPFSLLASVVIWGDVTGGHFNPAVTLGVWTTLPHKGANFIFMLMIWAAQILGGFLAIGMAYLGNFGKGDPGVPILAPTNFVTGKIDNAPNELGFSMDLQVLTNEIVCTFIFISVILMVKGKHTAGDRVGIGAAMCVVLTLLAVISATNKLGACFNPAVGVALTSNSVMMLSSESKAGNAYLYHYCYAYIIGPLVGGLMAGLFHNLAAEAHKPCNEHENEFDATHREKMISN